MNSLYLQINYIYPSILSLNIYNMIDIEIMFVLNPLNLN